MNEYVFLEKSDSLKFSCTRCGDCCRHRSDVLLSPFDIWNIGKSLKIPVSEIVEEFCEVYVGTDSKAVVVRLRPTGDEQSCPFLTGNECRVQMAKPSVCALYPLGRVCDKEMRYFLQPAPCTTRGTVLTLAQFLMSNRVEESFAKTWARTILEVLSPLGHGIQKLNVKGKQIAYELIFKFTYELYDYEDEFLSQYERNVMMLLHVLKETGIM